LSINDEFIQIVPLIHYSILSNMVISLSPSKLLFILLLVVNCCYLINAKILVTYYRDYDIRGNIFGAEILDTDYQGDGSEFSWTTNNGTVKFPQYLTRRSMENIPVVIAIVSGVYREPIIASCNGTQVYNTTLGGVYIPPLTGEYPGEWANLTILGPSTAGQQFSVSTDGLLTEITLEHDSNGNAVPIPLYFSYSVFRHFVGMSNRIYAFSAQVGYINPAINSYSCMRGYARVAGIVTYCNFHGDRLYETPYFSGLQVLDQVVSLTLIQATLKSILPINATFSLDKNYYLDRLTPTYLTGTANSFLPLPTTNLLKFQTHDDSVSIQGTFLDGIQLNNITLHNDGTTISLQCNYSYNASDAIGFVEYITCEIPNTKIKQDATIVLVPTFYSDQPIELKSESISFGIVIQPSIFTTTTLFLFTLLVLSILF